MKDESCHNGALPGLREMRVRGIGEGSRCLKDDDGRVYRELEANVWADADSFERANVLYLATYCAAGETSLKPLFCRIQGTWCNIATGQPAPFSFLDSTCADNRRGDVRQGERVLADMGWKQKCEALLSVCESFVWAPTLEEAYQRACDSVAEVLVCDETHLHIKSVDGTRYIKCAYRLKGEKKYKWDENHPATIGRMQWMLDVRRPIIMDYEHPHFADKIPAHALEAGVKSAVTIPLQASGEVVGTCSAVYRRSTEWSEEDEEFLLAIGREVGTFIKRIQDTKKAAELEVLDERRRLSGEIHDNVSTLIGSLSLCASAAGSALEDGETDRARQGLRRLEEMAVEAMRVLRDEIISLRLPLEKDDGFLESVESLLDRYERSWGIGVELDASGFRLKAVPLQVSLQLTRILNECLSNTLKHADARNVTVRLESGPSTMSLTVSDDGCGFDVDAVNPERFGLKIMQERAATIGAKVIIDSSGAGTTVQVEVPLLPDFARGGSDGGNEGCRRA